MTRQLKIIVKKDGSISIDAEGFKGKGCAETIEKFKSLGKETHSAHKPEYYQDDNNFNAVLEDGQS